METFLSIASSSSRDGSFERSSVMNVATASTVLVAEYMRSSACLTCGILRTRSMPAVAWGSENEYQPDGMSTDHQSARAVPDISTSATITPTTRDTRPG